MNCTEEKIYNQFKEILFDRKSGFSIGHDSIRRENKFVICSYRGNDIFTVDTENKTLIIDACGWFSKTTKSRLNCYLYFYGYSIRQTKGTWQLLKNHVVKCPINSRVKINMNYALDIYEFNLEF